MMSCMAIFGVLFGIYVIISFVYMTICLLKAPEESWPGAWGGD